MEIREALAKAKEAYEKVFEASHLEAQDRETISRLASTLYISSTGPTAKPQISKPITEKQIIYLKDLLTKAKVDIPALFSHYGVESFEELSSRQASELIEKLRKKVRGGFASKGGESQ
jgi:hypothetical protein